MNVELMARIIKKSATIFEERYGGDFFVLFWKEELLKEESYQRLLEEMKELNLSVIEVENILPNYYPKSPTYFIPYDGHPNAYTHDLISEYLLSLISKKRP